MHRLRCSGIFVQFLGIADVGFHAYTQGNAITTLRGTIIVDSVDRNEGGGYNQSSGVFTVPVGGLYHLYWTIYSFPEISLKVNSSRVIQSYTYKAAMKARRRPTGSFAFAYLRLKKEDRVYLQIDDALAFRRPRQYFTFSGELIRH